MCYEERELAVIKQQKKRQLNLCVWHIPEAVDSPFAEFLRKYRHHVSLFIKFRNKVCDLIYMQGSYYRFFSQKLSSLMSLSLINSKDSS